MIHRKMLNIIEHMTERTDKVAAVGTALFMLWGIADQFIPGKYRFSEHVHPILTFIELVVAALLAIYWLMRFFFRSPNNRWLLILGKKDLASLRLWLARGGDIPSINDFICKTKFAMQSDMAELSRINYEAFRGTAYEAPLEQFYERNKALVKQNEKCFSLFIDPIFNKELIGYSCLISLNELGTSLYLDGGVSDANLRPELVAKADEIPASVLIFAIHLREGFSCSRTGASRKYTDYFWSCILKHMKDVCEDVAKLQGRLDLYVQTQERSLYRRLTNRLGFTDMGKKSKDNYPILHFQLRR